MGNTYVYGDTHQNIDTKVLNDWSHKHQNKLSKEDVLIVLGDWAGIISKKYRGIRKEEKLLRKWIRKPFTLLVQLGNHENYDKIEKLPTIEMFGGKVYEKVVNEYGKKIKLGSIYIMQRGEIYTVNGKTIFSMGGAMTYDPNPDFYWSRELPSKDEYQYAFNKLKSIDFKVDYVITHNCPVEVGNELKNEFKAYGRSMRDTYRLSRKTEDPISRWFSIIVRRYKLSFTQWHFGHWHLNYNKNGYLCHYNETPYKLK
ncbi:MAG TPA: metallophosphatase family protein [Bacteroidia bacterium]|nr:metallophosphatase family protein [Bacteroidia bacterium]